MKTAFMEASYGGAAGFDAAAVATDLFLRLAPAMVAGCAANLKAEIVGPVSFRQGDGVMHQICLGRISVEVCSTDAVVSWSEGAHRDAAAMPFRDFHRYVVEGAIRLLACCPHHPGTEPPAAAPDEVWGELAAIAQSPARAGIATLPTPQPNPFPERAMSQRLDYYKASKDATNAMIALEKAISQLGLEKDLLELVRLRASQINGCAYCVDHHTAEARRLGETDRRLHGVLVWRETPFFTPRERAALAWTESLTLLPQTHAPDEDFAQVREQFSDKEVVDLTVAIIAVNGWNRLGVGFRRSPEA